MGSMFEELDYAVTPIGALSLRRRRELSLDVDVFEIKLGEEFLMSSLFTASEIALADLALAKLPGEKLDVVVGGLGLGYTAHAVLKTPHISSLIVIEMLEPVIEWHKNDLLPGGAELENDPRCEIRQGDFFDLAKPEKGFDESVPGRKFDAILLDIDHSPEALLDERSSSFYQPERLRQLATHIKPGGIFALWSNDRPDSAFTGILEQVFDDASAESVTFFNPLQRIESVQTVYLGRKLR